MQENCKIAWEAETESHLKPHSWLAKTHNLQWTQNREHLPKDPRGSSPTSGSQLLRYILEKQALNTSNSKNQQDSYCKTHKTIAWVLLRKETEKLFLKGSYIQTHPTPEPSSDAVGYGQRPKGKEVYLFILKAQPEGQASNLTHKSRSLLECSLGMATGRCPLHTLPLPCSRGPISPRREILHISGAPIF